MKRALILAATGMLMTGPAFAQTQAPTNDRNNAPAATPPATTTTPKGNTSAQATTKIPANAMMVSQFYNQAVYDSNNNKIGDINDILMDQNEKATLAIIGVGGFLGIGEKNVAVPFDSIKRSIRDGNVRLTMDANKDQLKSAEGLRYDRTTNAWGPDTASNTTNNNASTPANRPAPNAQTPGAPTTAPRQ